MIEISLEWSGELAHIAKAISIFEVSLLLIKEASDNIYAARNEVDL